MSPAPCDLSCAASAMPSDRLHHRASTSALRGACHRAHRHVLRTQSRTSNFGMAGQRACNCRQANATMRPAYKAAVASSCSGLSSAMLSARHSGIHRQCALSTPAACLRRQRGGDAVFRPSRLGQQPSMIASYASSSLRNAFARRHSIANAETLRVTDFRGVDSRCQRAHRPATPTTLQFDDTSVARQYSYRAQRKPFRQMHRHRWRMHCNIGAARSGRDLPALHKQALATDFGQRGAKLAVAFGGHAEYAYTDMRIVFSEPRFDMPCLPHRQRGLACGDYYACRLTGKTAR